MAYLTKAQFTTKTLAPAELVSDVERSSPGFVDDALEDWSRQIDARLRKRYAVPFAEPYPVAVQSWLARIVTLRLFLKRGVDPTDMQIVTVEKDHDRALEEIKEAADSNEGLYDLPLIEGSSSSGIAKGGPLSYTETSPYVGFDVQSDVGRNEDSNRSGSYG